MLSRQNALNLRSEVTLKASYTIKYSARLLRTFNNLRHITNVKKGSAHRLPCPNLSLVGGGVDKMCCSLPSA